MKGVLFANGQPPANSLMAALVSDAELTIAADGGAEHCLKIGLLADILVGDFDSIPAPLVTQYSEAGREIHKFPVRKDATDLELCLDLALERGCSELAVIAPLGGRWDMSFGNVLLAASPRYRSIAITLYGPDCRMYILHPGSHSVSSQPGNTLSLMPLQNMVTGLSLSGVEYPLTEQTVHFGSSLCLSNVFTEKLATIEFISGILLCVTHD